MQAENADMLGSVWEFPRSRLRLQTVLGEGNFGKVWKAEADDICGYDGTILVAVKTVKVIKISLGGYTIIIFVGLNKNARYPVPKIQGPLPTFPT